MGLDCGGSVHGAIRATKGVDGKNGIALLPKTLIHEQSPKPVTNHRAMLTLTGNSTYY